MSDPDLEGILKHFVALTQFRCNRPAVSGTSQNWDGSSLAGNPCQRWLDSLTCSWKDGGQAPGWDFLWGPQIGACARAGTRPAPKGIRWDWRDLGRRNSLDAAPVMKTGTRSMRHVVGRGRCGGGAPAQGRPLAADRPELQRSGAGVQGFMFRDGVTSDSKSCARWVRLCSYVRDGSVRRSFGSHLLIRCEGGTSFADRAVGSIASKHRPDSMP